MAKWRAGRWQRTRTAVRNPVGAFGTVHEHSRCSLQLATQPSGRAEDAGMMSAEYAAATDFLKWRATRKNRLPFEYPPQALKRVHIKYLSDAPVAQLLALHALPFHPKAVACCAPVPRVAEGPGSALLVQEHQLCLMASLLLDACQSWLPSASALFFESTMKAESLLGSIFPDIWRIHSDQTNRHRLVAEALFP
ncbi:unnamed protein product [Durusdinium trenchii]|uniref:Uncharacterized protein n=1 Tax=Durusdinium trenchii TaxID=1381693 RepID=A0ABP0J344_9DINO